MTLPSAAQDAGPRPAFAPVAIAAAAVLVLLFARPMAETLGYVLADRAYSQDPAAYAGLILRSQVLPTLMVAIPFALLVLALLWLVLPIRAGLPLGTVLGRGVLTALIATAITALLGVLVAAFVNVAGTDPALVQQPPPGAVLRNLLDSVRAALPSAVGLLLDGLVLVPFAAVLVWLHGRRALEHAG